MTFVVDLRPDVSDRPTGEDVFADGLAPLGVAPVTASGRAQLTVSDLVPGDHQIVAHHRGDTQRELLRDDS